MSKNPKKTKKPKPERSDSAEPTIEQIEKLLGDDEYKKYVQNYTKRMKRLEREASGENMYEPEY